MKIFLNGAYRDIDETTNVMELVGQFCKETEHIICEVNGDVLNKEKWESRVISDGDKIELVNYVGGG